MSTVSKQKKSGGALAGTANYLDERVGLGIVLKGFGRKVFPDHWSFMLGEVALYSFVILVLTGTFLTFFYQPSMAEVYYQGSYAPLKGAEMSIAYASSLDISFDIRGGLLMRQVHHWAALLFIAAIGLHMLRVFFTGAFRKPRELNWVVGFLLFLMAMGAGFTGYSLPDDLLSGNGLRIIDGMLKGIPVIGTSISSGFFGGEFPGTEVVARLYSLHIMIIPALIIVFIALHLMMVIIHKHSHYSGPGRTDENVVGYPLMPVYVAKAGGFFFLVFGVIMAISATFTINPIWNYGPYDPSPVSAGTQPDWYIGWLDGALRLAPTGWDISIAGYVIPMGVMVPLVVSLVFLALVAAYPFIENWVTQDKREHHVLDRPRNAPTRTAIGAAGVTFYGVLWAGASTDLIAINFQMSLNQILLAMQILLIIGPVIAYWVTKRACLSLQRKDREIALHGRESGRVVRLPHGEYIEIHDKVDKYELWKLVDFKDYQPTMARPNKDGKITLGSKIRARVSSIYFEDRIAPVSKAEYELANADHAPESTQEVKPKRKAKELTSK
ncbi:cytochrome bc complex cytochrome b subunit [Candidatus Aquiluna sp. UB-MaderosW2red]|uniref:cytochrome bc1 complex cytochrome b subunit n=1 Tax=Candidatus Aquiluna sp. UB-MaderosW2red TaxID=1855377 RepID=UPI000875C5DB|nr:cytochrome bc complex cytochrome b subunit [Candidatus Aquiluna sp. UB-MaderosW2red]SCX12420.1 ubiquinol-cytochrome c reductase cytochrome b subunit [Candidatus Aquiluna sp. UB-MaderosW2red]